jgi:predicted secreted protein
MTLGKKAFATKLYIGDGASPEQFTKIDEVFSIGPVGGSKSTVDFTNHDTLGYMDYEIFDLKEGNEIAVQANDIDSNASQALIRAADAASSKDNYQVIARTGFGYQFPGVIMKLDTDYSDLKGRVVLSFSIKIAGDIIPVTVSP